MVILRLIQASQIAATALAQQLSEPPARAHNETARKNKRTGNGYGPCSAICPISFRLITFEIRQIAIKADHSRDHQGCANKYCFSSFSFSATLKSSRFQVVKGIIMAKSAVVHKTTNTSRNIVPIENTTIISPAYRRKESSGHLYFYMCWMENLRD